MPQPDNQRERGGRTQATPGNTVAPSGVSGVFNQGSAAEAAAISNIMGQAPTQIKIGQQGRIIDDGTGLWRALEGAAIGVSRGVEQYEKMYQYTSKKKFNEWDVDRLSYATSVKEDPILMGKWLKDNPFEANDVNAKDYNTILARASKKEYDQFEIDRYNEASGKASLMPLEDAQAFMVEFQRGVDQNSPIYSRVQQEINSANSKLVQRGIQSRVDSHMLGTTGEIFNIGETLTKEAGVDPMELAGDHGKTIAEAVALWGNRAPEPGAVGITVNKQGTIEFHTGNGEYVVRGAFNGDLNPELMTAIHSALGDAVDPNDSERFAMATEAFKARFHPVHTARQGSGPRGGGSRTANDYNINSLNIADTLATKKAPEDIVRSLLGNGFPDVITPEAWLAAGNTSDAGRREANAKAYNSAIEVLVNEFSAAKNEVGMPPIAFAARKVTVASEMLKFLRNEDQAFSRLYNPNHEHTDNKAIKRLEEMREDAIGVWSTEHAALTEGAIANEIKAKGPSYDEYDVTINRVIRKANQDAVNFFAASGMAYTVYTLDENNNAIPVTSTATDSQRSVALVTGDPLSEEDILIAVQPLGDVDGLPAAFTGDGEVNETTVFSFGTNQKLSVISEELKRRRELRAERRNAATTMRKAMDASDGNPPTVDNIPTRDQLTSATKWYIDFAMSGKGEVVAAMRLAAPFVSADSQAAPPRLYVQDAITSNSEYLIKLGEEFGPGFAGDESIGATAGMLANPYYDALVGDAGVLAANGFPGLYGAIVDATVAQAAEQESGQSASISARGTQRVMHRSVWTYEHQLQLATAFAAGDPTEMAELEELKKLENTPGGVKALAGYFKKRFETPEWGEQFQAYVNRAYDMHTAVVERRSYIRTQAQSQLAGLGASINENKSFETFRQRVKNTIAGDSSAIDTDLAWETASESWKEMIENFSVANADIVGQPLVVEGIASGRKRELKETPFLAAVAGLYGKRQQTLALEVYAASITAQEADIRVDASGDASTVRAKVANRKNTGTTTLIGTAIDDPFLTREMTLPKMRVNGARVRPLTMLDRSTPLSADNLVVGMFGSNTYSNSLAVRGLRPTVDTNDDKTPDAYSVKDKATKTAIEGMWANITGTEKGGYSSTFDFVREQLRHAPPRDGTDRDTTILRFNPDLFRIEDGKYVNQDFFDKWVDEAVNARYITDDETSRQTFMNSIRALQHMRVGYLTSNAR